MLIAEHTGERNAGERSGRGSIDLARRPDFRQARARNFDSADRISSSHCERRDVHQLRAGGVGDVGCVQAAAELRDEPGIDGAESEVAGLGRRARAVDMVEQPTQF